MKLRSLTENGAIHTVHVQLEAKAREQLAHLFIARYLSRIIGYITSLIIYIFSSIFGTSASSRSYGTSVLNTCDNYVFP